VAKNQLRHLKIQMSSAPATASADTLPRKEKSNYKDFGEQGIQYIGCKKRMLR
jgi:hypothetical protein